MKSMLKLGTAILTTLTLWTAAAQAESVKVRVSTGFPSVHDVPKKLITPWFEDLSKKSGVDIEVEWMAAGSSMGVLDKQLTQVQKGLVDAAVGLAAVPRGRMPHLNLGDAPFLSADQMVTQKAFDDNWDDVLKDFPDVRLVGIGIDCSRLHTANKEIKTLEDLQGLRIRVPSSLLADLVASVGAVPVTLPQSEVYESLERNVIDGAVSPWDIIESLKLGEVLQYHHDAPLACGELWFGFNQKKFDKLPQAVQDAVAEMDRMDYAERSQKLYGELRESAMAQVLAKGGVIGDLSPEDLAKWQELSAPATEKYLSEVEAAGTPDIRDSYNRLVEAVAKHRASN